MIFLICCYTTLEDVTVSRSSKWKWIYFRLPCTRQFGILLHERSTKMTTHGWISLFILLETENNKTLLDTNLKRSSGHLSLFLSLFLLQYHSCFHGKGAWGLNSNNKCQKWCTAWRVTLRRSLPPSWLGYTEPWRSFVTQQKGGTAPCFVTITLSSPPISWQGGRGNHKLSPKSGWSPEWMGMFWSLLIWRHVIILWSWRKLPPSWPPQQQLQPTREGHGGRGRSRSKCRNMGGGCTAGGSVTMIKNFGYNQYC